MLAFVYESLTSLKSNFFALLRNKLFKLDFICSNLKILVVKYLLHRKLTENYLIFSRLKNLFFLCLFGLWLPSYTRAIYTFHSETYTFVIFNFLIAALDKMITRFSGFLILQIPLFNRNHFSAKSTFDRRHRPGCKLNSFKFLIH